jgi:hypothetical protein
MNAEVFTLTAEEWEDFAKRMDAQRELMKRQGFTEEWEPITEDAERDG